MAHKLPILEKRTGTRKLKLPDISGRFGISFYLGGKEVFLGCAVSDTVLETVTRKRVVKISKGTMRSLQFDPLDE